MVKLLNRLHIEIVIYFYMFKCDSQFYLQQVFISIFRFKSTFIELVIDLNKISIDNNHKSTNLQIINNINLN
jgi:hypothetical protein